MRRLCLAIDLADPASAERYEALHSPGQTPAAVIRSLRRSGILAMEIYRIEARLFMVLDVDDAFSPERSAALNRDDAEVQTWNRLMASLQAVVPGDPSAQGWRPASRVFRLADHDTEIGSDT